MEKRWLSCFTRLLGEFNGRYVQLAGLHELCELHLGSHPREESKKGPKADEEVDESDLSPTGHEKEELLRYFLTDHEGAYRGLS